MFSHITLGLAESLFGLIRCELRIRNWITIMPPILMLNYMFLCHAAIWRAIFRPFQLDGEMMRFNLTLQCSHVWWGSVIYCTKDNFMREDRSLHCYSNFITYLQLFHSLISFWPHLFLYLNHFSHGNFICLWPLSCLLLAMLLNVHLPQLKTLHISIILCIKRPVLCFEFMHPSLFNTPLSLPSFSQRPT